MKKNKLGNLFKIGILFFGISLFLFGCEQQSELNQEIKSNIPQENSLKKKSLNQLSNDNQFNTVVENFRIDNVLRNGSNLLLAKKSDSQISIDTDSIVEIKKENYISYTFRLKSQENTNNGILENLVIEQRNDTIQGFLIKYKFSELYLEKLKKNIEIPFQGKIKRTKYSNNIEELFKSVQNSKSSNKKTSKSSEYICETSTVIISTTCASGRHKVGQTCDYTGTSRAASSREFTSTNCWYDDSSWSDYDTVLDYIASDDPSSGGSSTSPNTQSCNSCYENLIAKDITTKLGLFAEQEQWLKTQSEEFLGDIDTFLKNNPNSFDAEMFTRELIVITSLELDIDNNVINFMLKAFNKDKIYNPFDSSFLNSVNQFMDLDVANANPNLVFQLQIYFTTKCAVLRFNHPDWSDNKIYWEASKDIVHIALDGFGLIPVVGEIADLANGALYLIEGDGVNATLSFAATIPIVGWASTGTKYAVKIVKARTVGTKVRLSWKVLENGVVYFGSTGSKLRKVLGLAPYAQDARQAHHIIPWGKRNNEVIQKAAKSKNAFHINESLNGIPLDNLVHLGSHTNYDNRVIAFLNQLPSNATPDQAYDHVNTLINNIRLAIANNPTTHIDNLIF